MEHGCHDDGDEETAKRSPVRRQDEIFAQAEDEEREGNCGDCDVGDTAREKEAKAVNEVVNGLEEELADVAVFDVGGDLPVVFVDGSEGVNDSDEQIIGDHLGETVSPNEGIRTFAFKDGAPDVNDRNEWDEAEEGSGEEIETVREIVLDADVEDVPVLFHD